MPRKPDPKPSEKQLELFRFIIMYVEDFGFQPSKQEMCDKFGVTKNAVTDRLKELEKRGLVRLPRGNSERAIALAHVRFRAVYEKDEEWADEPPE